MLSYYDDYQASTATSFKYVLTIDAQTFRLTMKYIAVNSTFPYHLNVLNDINLQSNIYNTPTTTSTSVLLNYTDVASTKPNKVFSNNSNGYSNYNVICYLTCLGFQDNSEWFNSPPILSPPISDTSYQIINQSFIDFNVTLGDKLMVTSLHYTIIVYDKYQLENAGYKVRYEHLNWTFN